MGGYIRTFRFLNVKIKKRITQGVTSYSSWKLCLLHKLGLTGPLQAFYGGETD